MDYTLIVYYNDREPKIDTLDEQALIERIDELGLPLMPPEGNIVAFEVIRIIY